MKRGRVFAYIYEVNSLEVKAYLLPGTDSLIQSHSLGISKIARIGSYVIINSAGIKLVGVVSSLHVTEPEKLYWIKTTADLKDKQIIRTINITLIGQFYFDKDNNVFFERGINTYPSIDEEVMAPIQEELDLILNEKTGEKQNFLQIGISYPTNDIDLKINPIKLFSRHCGVFGSTGNGKSCTVTVIINEILKNKLKLPVFIFDINGEYSWAFQNMQDILLLKFIGSVDSSFNKQGKQVLENLTFNYRSFSRFTLRAILKPSEKTQLPALNFGVDSLDYLPLNLDDIELDGSLNKYIPTHLKDNPQKAFVTYLIGDPSVSNQNRLKEAFETVEFLTTLTARKIKTKTKKNIHMAYLSRVISDKWSIISRNGFEYNSFRYQNVAYLCDRINELCRDRLFRTFCDTTGRDGIDLGITTSSEYQDNGNVKKADIVIFDLSLIPQEYLNIVVDSMLGQHLLDALERKFINEPHLLVLDEAHHYLGSRLYDENNAAYLNNPPGERIAKEGRKYGLHLLICSQRPREMSHTITSQIGTIISHALTHELDRDIISGFGTYNDKTILNSLSILPRREAIIIGQAISMPTRFKVTFLPEEKRPRSKDPLEDIL